MLTEKKITFTQAICIGIHTFIYTYTQTHTHTQAGPHHLSHQLHKCPCIATYIHRYLHMHVCTCICAWYMYAHRLTCMTVHLIFGDTCSHHSWSSLIWLEQLFSSFQRLERWSYSHASLNLSFRWELGVQPEFPMLKYGIRHLQSPSCFFFSFFVHDYITNCDQQQPTTPPIRALAFIYPLKISQNSKCHTLAETVCSWQNHTPARAQGKT